MIKEYFKGPIVIVARLILGGVFIYASIEKILNPGDFAKLVKEFIDNGPTDSELEAAKSNLIGGFPLRLESNKKIVEYISMMAFYDYPIDYLDTFSDNVNAVTVNQIREAYKKRVNIDDFTTVIVGIE